MKIHIPRHTKEDKLDVYKVIALMNESNSWGAHCVSYIATNSINHAISEAEKIINKDNDRYVKTITNVELLDNEIHFIKE